MRYTNKTNIKVKFNRQLCNTESDGFKIDIFKCSTLSTVTDARKYIEC